MSLPRLPVAVVFDMDGLLCDTEVVYRDAMTATCAEHGHDMPLTLFQSMIGLPGPAGNVEFFLWLRRDAPPPREDDVRRAIEEGPQ